MIRTGFWYVTARCAWRVEACTYVDKLFTVRCAIMFRFRISFRFRVQICFWFRFVFRFRFRLRVRFRFSLGNRFGFWLNVFDFVSDPVFGFVFEYRGSLCYCLACPSLDLGCVIAFVCGAMFVAGTNLYFAFFFFYIPGGDKFCTILYVEHFVVSDWLFSECREVF